MSDIVLYANPYDITAGGFYFTSAEEFERKFNKRLPVEEYEIDFIDGSSEDAGLFEAVGVHQANLGAYFELIADLDDYEKPAMYYVLSEMHPGMDWEEARRLVDDEVRVMEGNVKDYVENLIDDLGGVGNLANNATIGMYFDYAAFGRVLGFDLDPDDPDDDYYFQMSDQERGEEYVDSMGGVSELGEAAETYFDVDGFARDMELNGEVTEFEFAGTTYVTDYR